MPFGYIDEDKKPTKAKGSPSELLEADRAKAKADEEAKAKEKPASDTTVPEGNK